MKKLLLFLILAASALFSQAQTTAAEQGDKFFEQKDYIKASNYYDQALKANPDDVRTLKRMGYCVMNFKGEERSATQFFNRVLKLQPNDAVANYYLGLIFMDAAKAASTITEKANFKAKSATYLKNAQTYGSIEANAAIKDLNAI